MNATLWNTVSVSLVPSNFADFSRSSYHRNKLFRRRTSSFSRLCVKNDKTSQLIESFSVLKSDDECDIASMWSSLAFYVFTIHVPLSFGGLSIAAKILHQPKLDPLLMACLILGIQILELRIALSLLKFPENSEHGLKNFFEYSEGRSSFVASVLGSGFLISLVLATSFFASRFIGAKVSGNQIVGEMLASSSISATVCIFAYCIIIPVLEEVVYRGFLLRSVASKLRWPEAVAISSLVFSAAHFSGESFLQLFVVGLVLGCAYCWSGKLVSSVAVHSSYNAFVLFLSYISFFNEH